MSGIEGIWNRDAISCVDEQRKSIEESSLDMEQMGVASIRRVRQWMRR